MLKPIEKIVFTPTGKVRPPKIGEFYLNTDKTTTSCGGVFPAGINYVTSYSIYTKSIELAQPEYKDGEYWQVNLSDGYKRIARAHPHYLSGQNGERIFNELIETGNIFSTKEEAQKVADEINLLIQEKGYFTLYPEKEYK